MSVWRPMKVMMTAAALLIPVVTTPAAHGGRRGGSGARVSLLRITHPAHRGTAPCCPGSMEQDPANVREGERAPTVAPHFVLVLSFSTNATCYASSSRQLVRCSMDEDLTGNRQMTHLLLHSRCFAGGRKLLITGRGVIWKYTMVENIIRRITSS